MNTFHVPVLLNEVLENLQIKEGKWYVDATVGGGGHTEKILERGGQVVAIDQDSDAIEYVRKRLKKYEDSGKLIIRQGRFSELGDIVKELKIDAVAGILLDIGMSTYQIRASGRGFSFRQNERLDMRMGKETKLTAEKIVNTYSFEELSEIVRRYGEENLAGPLSSAIISTRKGKDIETTQELAKIVIDVYGRNRIREKIHPATRLFQALRIAVNDELGQLRMVLPIAFETLDTEGRLAVISFHSLEDRIVKQFLARKEIEKQAWLISKKPIGAGQAEIITNPASRSAKMRVLEKI